MEKDKAIEALELFNEKSDELIDSGFVKHIQDIGLKVRLKMVSGRDIEVTHTLPDKEIVKAFVLTIRFFIQDNECSSIRNLAKIYEEMPGLDDLKQDFLSAKKNLNDELEKSSFIHLNGVDLAYGKIFDTFIYGGLAHANRTKKEEYKNWLKDESIAALIMSEFYNVLWYFLNCIAYIKQINTKAIQEINNL
jgi:hypothetical protein